MQDQNRCDDIDINIRAGSFLLARTVTACAHCRAPTRVAALVVPPGHMALELDDEAENESTALDAWRPASHYAFLFHVEFLSSRVQNRLSHVAPLLRPLETDGGVHWCNHCERCGAVLDDHELFCEPDGAFLPTSESSAGRIELLLIDAAFAAAAGGYSDEPPFFAAMRQELT